MFTWALSASDVQILTLEDASSSDVQILTHEELELFALARADTETQRLHRAEIRSLRADAQRLKEAIRLAEKI